MGPGFYGAAGREAETATKPRIGAPIRIVAVRGDRRARRRPADELERDQTVGAGAKGGKNKIARPASGIARFNKNRITKGHGGVKKNLPRGPASLKERRCRRIRGSESL